ncbi:MAG: galactose-1-phosphate uridylyltransferase [Brevinematales bacterium]|jgi:UDPglucose--hexose-1-phosphate uridylyltransferase
MPQLRQNIILKEWVIIATERAKRPEELKENKDISLNIRPPHDENCPFCPGNEEKTGNTAEFYRYGGSQDWKIRVIPNKFPALSPPENEISHNTSGNFRWMDGVGNHEVVIETPRHDLTMATMDTPDVVNILKTYQKRIKTLYEIPYIESVIPFRNHGTRAGASLVHPHSQIIALPIIPKDIMERMNESIRFHEEHRECIFCRVLRSELETGERVVLDTKDYTVFVPYAAFSPFAMWLFPKRHTSSILEVTDEELAEAASVLRQALRKLYFGVNDPDYNFIIRGAPKGYSNSVFFHWYITIVPRLTRTAGFELGSGMFINPSIPEENADYLRKVEI